MLADVEFTNKCSTLEKCGILGAFFTIDLFLMSSCYSNKPVWSIMADLPRIGINNPNLFSFGSMIKHTL